MDKNLFALPVSPAIRSVSAEYLIPAESIALMTLAHGAGAGKDHPFMTALSTALAELQVATLRFNFPFIENNKKRADLPAVAHKTIEAAMHHARDAYPHLPLFMSGKSFGGRMSSQYLALNPTSAVNGMIFFGFPLHPAGKPSVTRAEHLKEVPVPMLFLQGTKDQLATIQLMEEVCLQLPKANIVKIEGADHGFKAGKLDTIQILANATVEWVKNILEL